MWKIFSRSTVGLENQKDKDRFHYGFMYNLLLHLNWSFFFDHFFGQTFDSCNQGDQANHYQYEDC